MSVEFVFAEQYTLDTTPDQFSKAHIYAFGLW